MKHVVTLVEQVAAPGTIIPKPEARGDFFVRRWGRRRGERALIYAIPNHRDEERPYEKGITESEWVAAHDRLASAGNFTRTWFRCALPACEAEGSCNFTTIGGVFELLGIARYVQRGTYEKT